MTFDYAEKVEFLHCIEVDTEDEELFSEIADDIADEMALRKFREAFGEDKVTFKEDGSGTVEYEAY